MSTHRVSGTVVSGKVSLTNGAPSGTLLPALPAGQRYYVYDLIATTNDVQQMVTVQDASAAPVQIVREYVGSTSPSAAYSQIGTPTGTGTAALVTATAGAVTAGKSIEIRCTALVSST